jgi:hypothetical protein
MKKHIENIRRGYNKVLARFAHRFFIGAGNKYLCPETFSMANDFMKAFRWNKK